MVRFILLIVNALYVLAGCNPPAKSPEQLIAWTEDPKNGLLINKTTNNYNYTLQYEPALYKMLRNEGNQRWNITQEDLDTDKYDDLHYFSFKITPKNHTSNHEKIESYLRTQYKKHLLFISGNDTIEGASMYHIESSGIKPYHHILLAYPKAGTIGGLSVQVLSNPLHEKSLKFSFSEKALKKVRRLNIK